MNGKIQMCLSKPDPVEMVRWTGENLPVIDEFVKNYGVVSLEKGVLMARGAYPVGCRFEEVAIGSYIMKDGIIGFSGGRVCTLVFLKKVEVVERFIRLVRKWGVFDMDLEQWMREMVGGTICFSGSEFMPFESEEQAESFLGLAGRDHCNCVVYSKCFEVPFRN